MLRHLHDGSHILRSRLGATVSVSDGRLTISNGPNSSNNKLTLIEVTELENLLTQSR